MDNFHAAMKVVNDPDIDAVGGVLQLAQDAILSDPKQLASQFVARLYEVHTIWMFFCPYIVGFFPYFLYIIVGMPWSSFSKQDSVNSGLAWKRLDQVVRSLIKLTQDKREF